MSTTNENRPRYTIDLDPAARASLNELAKTYKLTQGEIIDSLVADLGLPDEDSHFDRLFKAKRQAKLNERTRRRELAAKLRDLPADKLAQIEALTQ